MCGRAKLPDDVSEIKLDLKIDFDEIGDYQPRWNAAPTTKLPVVVVREWPAHAHFDALGSGAGHNSILGPSTARSATRPSMPAPKASISARSSAPPGKRDAVAWLLPTAITSGATPTSSPSPSRLGNRGPMTMAGLWETWTAPDGAVVKSFAIITTAANELLQPLHGRMPAHPGAGTLGRLAR